ncbi:MAG: sortase, partial [Desulfomonile tiedjei]|nr:sortase [Desulfomonile tiedjei]
MLDGESVTVHAKKPKQYSPPVQEKPRPAMQKMERLVPPPTPGLSLRFKKSVSGAISQSIAEGKRQLQATLTGAESEIVSTRGTLRTLPARMRGALRNFWRSMNTPVTLTQQKPGRNHLPPTKLRLFIVDTVRFGGTFAGIFVILFVGINYQSFWQIARAQLALGGDIKTEQALEQMVHGTLATALTQESRTTSADTKSLLAYLPPVGPFENRLVIPKLGKNVPIVRPSMDALMKENWKVFEEDIQTALHDGVVHYPGSARPGQAGNFFITGHSSYYPWDDGGYKDVFARLSDLVIGDTYSVYYNGDRHTYRVTSKKEVSPN